jgi:hypothetical protein
MGSGLVPAPPQRCPDCLIDLTFAVSNSGGPYKYGSREAHQFDYHTCPQCGSLFQYSHEDKRLRRQPRTYSHRHSLATNPPRLGVVSVSPRGEGRYAFVFSEDLAHVAHSTLDCLSLQNAKERADGMAHERMPDAGMNAETCRCRDEAWRTD